MPTSARRREGWDRWGQQHARRPIGVACYDIIGKATGRPVADLLGGRYWESVPSTRDVRSKGRSTTSGIPRT